MRFLLDRLGLCTLKSTSRYGRDERYRGQVRLASHKRKFGRVWGVKHKSYNNVCCRMYLCSSVCIFRRYAFLTRQFPNVHSTQCRSRTGGLELGEGKSRSYQARSKVLGWIGSQMRRLKLAASKVGRILGSEPHTSRNGHPYLTSPVLGSRLGCPHALSFRGQ